MGTSKAADPGRGRRDPVRQLVRLTFEQIGTSLDGLLGPELASSIREEHFLYGHGDFPALSSPDEGTQFTPITMMRTDAVAQAAATKVLEHFDALTDCGPDPDDACAEEFLVGFAARAFRRPLAEEERENVLQVFAEAKTLGASVARATSTAVQSIFHSPSFLYRTEFGDSAERGETMLAPYELSRSYWASVRQLVRACRRRDAAG